MIGRRSWPGKPTVPPTVYGNVIEDRGFILVGGTHMGSTPKGTVQAGFRLYFCGNAPGCSPLGLEAVGKASS